MQEIEPISIVGIDPNRPPVIQRMPCIDLFFVLSDKAPPAWCEAFSDATKGFPFKTRVEASEGEFIESWVRLASEIPGSLERIKGAVLAANQAYHNKVMASRSVVDTGSTEKRISPEQAALNDIVAGLEW